MDKKLLVKYLSIFKGRTINIMLDTSGSTHGFNTQVLDSLHNKTKYFLFQIDTQIRAISYVNTKSLLNQLKYPVGMGGTVIQPTLDNISKRNNNPIVFITDGYTEELNFDHIKNQVYIILVGKEECNCWSVRGNVLGNKKPKEVYFLTDFVEPNYKSTLK